MNMDAALIARIVFFTFALHFTTGSTNCLTSRSAAANRPNRTTQAIVNPGARVLLPRSPQRSSLSETRFGFPADDKPKQLKQVRVGVFVQNL
jgi:hypothetical protein